MKVDIYDTLINIKDSETLKNWYIDTITSTVYTDEFPTPSFEEYLRQLSKITCNEVVKLVDEAIQVESSVNGQELKLTKCITNIDNYIRKMNDNQYLSTNHDVFIQHLIQEKQKILDGYSYLNIVLPTKPISTHRQKIQWLGKINLLTTLFYDLMYGQEKGEGKTKFTTQPLIKAQKKQIMQLLLDNFVDSEAKPLSETTLSDYLSESPKHNKYKVQKDYRIELPSK